MMKRTWKGSWSWAILLAVVVTGGVWASGRAQADILSPIELTSDRLVRVEGKVQFAKHATVVPMTVCENGPCYKSKTYWTLVVVSNDRNYEVGQPFGFGLQRAPEAVEVSGAIIRRGALVAVEGKIDTLTASYGVISEVHRVEIMGE